MPEPRHEKMRNELNLIGMAERAEAGMAGPTRWREMRKNKLNLTDISTATTDRQPQKDLRFSRHPRKQGTQRMEIRHRQGGFTGVPMVRKGPGELDTHSKGLPGIEAKDKRRGGVLDAAGKGSQYRGNTGMGSAGLNSSGFF
ncbi:hypothetical protein BDZ91DRAFT_797925 [Kalaharituber pfeilii]|nr:hypothetical protein BDZ91DRAFT_797925 [Kalaharituber pfeilii]